ncbi:MAG: hypothetical protein CL441_09080 [Acidimicrobiaceae bacterium]|nr:hypothetical protein [Acidimicrobiaceae bacterium]
MASPQSTEAHPSTDDLLKLAKERLGRKRTERILAHCRGCQPCADRLLALIGAQPADKSPLRFGPWMWVSLALLVATVLALVGGMWWLTRLTAG